MKVRLVAVLATLVVGLTVTGSAFAFDCIRVSSSLQGLIQSTAKSGNWLLFDVSNAEAVQKTFAEIGGPPVDSAQAQCFADAYAKSGKPIYFGLGIGVAGGKKTSAPPESGARDFFGVLAWHNKNVSVLSNGKGIDLFENSGIIEAFVGAAEDCGIEVPEE